MRLCFCGPDSSSLILPSPAGSFTSISPVGSLSGRPLQVGTFADVCDAPSSPRYSFPDPFAPTVGVDVMFEAPELPEETLMEVRGCDGGGGGVASVPLTISTRVSSRSTRTPCRTSALCWTLPAVWWRWPAPAEPTWRGRMALRPGRRSSRAWWRIRSAL